MASFAEGGVTLSPDDPVRVKEAGCWTLAFVVGESGLAPGAAIHVTIPHGFTPPQVDNLDAPGFVIVKGVPEWSDVVAAVGIAPGGSDLGVFLYVERGPLKNGDRFQMIYGAGPGQAYASAFAGAALFRVTVCAERDKETIFLPLQEMPALDVSASAFQQLEVIAPSSGRAGEPLIIRVIGRDGLGNRCRDWAGWFKVEAEGVLIPASQRNQDVTGAGVELGVGLTDRLTGPLRLRVRESETDVVGVSNPILVDKQAPIWGDLHACLPEGDGQVPELDFQLGVGDMPTLDRISFHFQSENPGEGAEGSAPSSGFLRFSLPDAGSDDMLPSHLLEIYSSWGNREYWGGRRTDVRAARNPEQTVHAVLAQGIIAGFAAGSNSRFGVGKDARRAEAGRGYGGGLTAVYATSIDHQAVFAALRERHCYATTGARILLQMDINGHEMGRLVEVREGERDILSERKISAQIYGTAPIERVEVLRNNVEVCTYQGDGEDVQFQWIDKQEMDRIALPRNLRGGGLTCYYYLRVTQENGEIAWSSPIWFMLKR